MISNYLINLKVLYFLGSKLRSFYILNIIKKITNLKKLNFIKYFFDPNIIKNKIASKFNENIKIVEKNNIKMAVNLNDHIGYNFFIDNNFDNKVIEIAKLINFKKNHIFIDIGANIGTSSIPFAKNFKCEVIAVEGSKHNAILLLKNILLNKVKVHPLINIITNKEEKVKNNFIKIYLQNGNMGASSVYRNWTSNINKDYELTKSEIMDGVIKISNIDFSKVKIIKIDIEGNENKLFYDFKNIKYLNSLIIFEHRIDRIKKMNKRIKLDYISNLEKKFKLYEINQINNKIYFKKFKVENKCDCLAVPKKNFYLIKKLKKNMTKESEH